MSANEHLTIRSDQWLAAGVLELGGTIIAGTRKTSCALALARTVVDNGNPVVYVTNDPSNVVLHSSRFYLVDWVYWQDLLQLVTQVQPALLVFDVHVADIGLAGEFPLAAILAATHVGATVVATAYLSKH